MNVLYCSFQIWRSDPAAFPSIRDKYMFLRKNAVTVDMRGTFRTCVCGGICYGRRNKRQKMDLDGPKRIQT